MIKKRAGNGAYRSDFSVENKVKNSALSSFSEVARCFFYVYYIFNKYSAKFPFTVTSIIKKFY